MSIKSFTVAALLALSAFAGTAQAAATWTVTAQGTINYGWDETGVFGVAGRDLTGMTYTQAITANVDPSQWAYETNYSDYRSLNGNSPGFTTEITVDGVRKTFTGAQGWSQQLLASRADAGWVDYIYSYNSGTTADGDYLTAHNYVYSWNNDFVPTVDFTQALDVAMDPWMGSNSSFNIDGNQRAYFGALVGSFSINGGTVPEPASLALLGLGLAGVAAARRKKSLSK